MMDEIDRICESKYTQQFYEENGLSDFYESHRQKSLKQYLRRYLVHPKLKKYDLLEDINQIKVNRTYLRYTYIEDAYRDSNIGKSIKVGGIVIGGGIFKGDKFIELENKIEWKYLLLKFDPTPQNSEKRSPKYYYLKINKCYLFYKITKKYYLSRDYVENIQIELKGM